MVFKKNRIILQTIFLKFARRDKPRLNTKKKC